MSRALLLSPHNDDETLFASFLCLRHRPHVVICLKSARMAESKYPGGMVVKAKTREFETAMAMKTFGCEWTQWPILDTDPQPEEVEAFMWGLRDPSSDHDWDLVFAPAVEEGGHPDHNLVGRLAEGVFNDTPVVNYLTYTAQEGRSRQGTLVEPEPEWVTLKLHALACYKSQAMHPATKSWFYDQIDLREWVAEA